MAADTGRSRTPQRTVVGLLIAVVAALVVWWTQGDGGTPAQDDPSTETSAGTTAAQPDGTATPSASSDGSGSPSSGSPSPSASTEPDVDPGTDPESGLPLVRLVDLPPEVPATIDLIDRGGPFPYPDRDDGVFENREGLLPDRPRGYYREYTVETPGSPDRGARRVVAGEESELYWTDDHYASFARIDRGDP